MEYWSNFFSKYFLKKDNVIIGGDFNFSLGASEVWGPKSILDPLSKFFIHHLTHTGLFEVEPPELNPT